MAAVVCSSSSRWAVVWPWGIFGGMARWLSSSQRGAVPGGCEAMRGGRKGACGPLIRPVGPPSPRWGEEGAGGNFFGFPIPLRGDHGLLWSGHAALLGMWLVCPSSPQRGDVPSGCEAMRGRCGRIGACGALIRPCGPPSPRWGEEGAGGALRASRRGFGICGAAPPSVGFADISPTRGEITPNVWWSPHPGAERRPSPSRGGYYWPGRPVLPLVFFWRLRSPASS